jgi:hypothetical protein
LTFSRRRYFVRNTLSEYGIIMLDRLYIWLGDRFNQVPAGVFPRDIFDSKMALIGNHCSQLVHHFWRDGISDLASGESDQENGFQLLLYVRNRVLYL